MTSQHFWVPIRTSAVAIGKGEEKHGTWATSAPAQPPNYPGEDGTNMLFTRVKRERRKGRFRANVPLFGAYLPANMLTLPTTVRKPAMLTPMSKGSRVPLAIRTNHPMKNGMTPVSPTFLASAAA